MDFINNTANIFKKLVIGDFCKKYNLKIVNNINYLKEYNQIYSGYNYIIIHNSILNQKYDLSLKDFKDKWSIVLILYKNIKYSIRNNKNIVSIDSTLKNSVKDTLKKFNDKLSDDVYVIGRKYVNLKDKLDKHNNCFGKICSISLNNYNNTQTTNTTNTTNDENCISQSEIQDSNTNISNDNVNISNDNVKYETINSLKRSKNLLLRRKFLFSLKDKIDNVYNCINNCIYLDLEYTNDIYDDFIDFPVSKDTSRLFMIGAVYKNSEKLCYNNFTTNDLSENEEMRNLENFLIFLRNFIKQKQKKVYIFHWSNADRYILFKSLNRYPNLFLNYDDVINNIFLVDLLPIVKETIPDMESYSLKKVSKKLLNIIYDTECQNGLEAMCSIIQNDISLKTSTEYDSLLSFENTKDIINYNRLDTMLLYYIFSYFTGR